MMQGGDFTKGNGTGGMSIYGGGTFPDENFNMKHSRKGLLSMANSGPNTNLSQFFITFDSLPPLDGKHVVFGELVGGNDLLPKLEKMGSNNEDGKPKCKICIAECGEM